MNQVQCIGRLAREVALVDIGNHNLVLNNVIAIPRRNAKDGEVAAEFVPIVAWNGTASLINKFLVKGDELGIVGQLRTRTYDHKHGHKVQVVEIFVNDVTFLRKKQTTIDTIEMSVPSRQVFAQNTDSQAISAQNLHD